MKADITIRKSRSKNYIMRVETGEGTMGSNLVPLSKDDARILSKTLGVKILDVNALEGEQDE